MQVFGIQYMTEGRFTCTEGGNSYTCGWSYLVSIVNIACNELHIALTEPLRVEKYNRDSFHHDICMFAWKATYHSIQIFRATPVLVSCPLVTLHNQLCQGSD